MELVIKQENGKAIDILVNSAPIFDDQKHIIGAVGIFQDITERKEWIKALQEAHDSLEHKVNERTDELIQVNQQLKDEIAERQIYQD